ncbi:MAG: aminotransferase class IV [Lachnospiraceae bacterium]|nr:aminotransferase class IV [Lachnospiraceae bacterium]
MKEIAYYDGKIGTPEELQVPFNDRVHFFGDGVYDATVGGNHKVYLMQDHLDRFYSSAKALDIKIPMEKEELGKLLTELLGKVEGDTHFVYWQVTRGAAARNHVYDEDMTGKLWVMIRPNRLRDPEKPIKLITKEDTRFYHCNIKTLNLLPSVIAAQEAERAGVDETVFHRGELVTECAHSNVSILKDGVFYSHPNDNLILRGISKTHMIAACYRLGIQVMERAFTLEELRAADEIIVTSSSNFCLHACELDGAAAGGKDPETLKAIQDAVIQEYLEYTGKSSIFD